MIAYIGGHTYTSDELELIVETGLSEDDLINRFLSWPLPNSVCADQCATVPNYKYHRTGTNLLTASEASAMFSDVLAAASDGESA